MRSLSRKRDDPQWHPQFRPRAKARERLVAPDELWQKASEAAQSPRNLPNLLLRVEFMTDDAPKDGPATPRLARLAEGLMRGWPVAAFFALGALSCCWGLRWLTAMPGDLGDTRFNLLILEHVHLWATGENATLWGPAFFYPYEDVLAFSDNHFGTAWIYTAFRLLGLERESALVHWFLAGTTLNFAAAYWVVRRLGFAVFAAAAGAFTFTFALPVLAQDGHVQLVYRFAVPLAFLACWRFWHSRRVFHLGLLVAALCAQFFCSIYHGVFLTYLLCACLVAQAVGTRLGVLAPRGAGGPPDSAARTWAAAAVAALLTVLLALMLLKYRAVAQDYGFARDYASIKAMLPRFSSYLLADGSRLSAWVGSWVTGIPMRHEHQLFPGLGVLFFALAGIRGIRSRRATADLAKLSAFALALLFCFTLMIDALSPSNSIYRLFAGLPGVNSLRAVSRIILVMLFPVALLTANGVETVLAECAPRSARTRFALCCALALVLGAETLAYRSLSVPIAAAQERRSRLRALVPQPLPDDAILFLTPAAPGLGDQTEIDGMVLAQELRRPTLNGYSGNVPRGYESLAPCQSPASRIAGYARFRKLPADSMQELDRRVVRVSPVDCGQSGEGRQGRPGH